ncbi:MAG: GntR family transcriptional regulator [Myxococcales bacterium]|jgi:DNA-binding FadR family transcriptional regulator
MVEPPNRHGHQRERESSLAEEVFETILRRVIDGSLGPGARVPSERDLAAQLGVARVLIDARVLSTRQGSGAVVLPRNVWSVRVLPMHLALGSQAGDRPAAADLLQDSLELRRAIALDLVERAAARLGDRSLEPARELVRAAWEVRDDAIAFAERDWRVIPTVVEQAGMMASLWLLNSMEETHVAAMVVVGSLALVPDDYLEVHLGVLDRIEAADGAGARELLTGYFDRLDASRLGAATSSGAE